MQVFKFTDSGSFYRRLPYLSIRDVALTRGAYKGVGG
jgi:hypothetical protein